MRRLFAALCALFLSVAAVLEGPARLDAASPPPPCPSGDTFIFCISECPTGNLEQACLSLAGRPPNCRVEQPFCFDIGSYTCDGLPWPDGNHNQLWCPYWSTL